MTPYGKQTLVDGTEVLFSRGYREIARRHPETGAVKLSEPAKVSLPHDLSGVDWFYDDHTPSAERRETIHSVLEEWGLA